MNNRSGWIQAIQTALREGLAVQDTELREDDPGSTCRPVRGHRSGKNLVVSFHAKVSRSTKDDLVCINDRLFPLFRELKGIACMSDYWILWERERDKGEPTLNVLLCELKSGRPEGALQQLENAMLLAEYFVKVVAHHQGLSVEHVHYRGVVFSSKGAPFKAGVKPKPAPYVEQGRLKIPIASLRDGEEYYLSWLCP